MVRPVCLNWLVAGVRVMTKLDRLIGELCPGGVECKPLGEICDITRGRVMSKDYLRDNAGEYPVYSSQTANDGIFGYINTYDYDCESVTWTTDGANAGSVFYHANKKFSITNVCGLLRAKDTNLINMRYIFYALQISAKGYVNDGMGNPKLMSNVMATVRVPVPPLAVQLEIVRILDNFTELAAELATELTARKKQYAYYRDELLTLWDAPRVLVGDLFDFKNGLNKGKDFFGKGTPIVNFTDVFRNRSLYASMLKGKVDVTPKEQELYSARKNDVFFTRTSEIQEEIGMATVLLDDIEGCVFSGFVLRARPKTNLLMPKYCAYCFSSNNVRKEIIRHSTYTTRALTNGKILSNLSVPTPSLEEQERIVGILDRFDALTIDISSGLPAEIAARQKQYEYYRDKLFTF